MELKKFKPKYSEEVITLFSDVFSDSEGTEEGQMIGQLVTELIAKTPSEDLLGYVCESEGKIIASIFFSRMQLQSGKTAFILSPVAVSSFEQGKGLGQQLINYGIQQLKTKGVELAFTYGDPNFYSKVGFTTISEDIVKAPKKLSYPIGWLAQSLTGRKITPEKGAVICVEALNKQEYW